MILKSTQNTKMYKTRKKDKKYVYNQKDMQKAHIQKKCKI